MFKVFPSNYWPQECIGVRIHRFPAHPAAALVCRLLGLRPYTMMTTPLMRDRPPVYLAQYNAIYCSQRQYDALMKQAVEASVKSMEHQLFYGGTISDGIRQPVGVLASGGAFKVGG